MIQRVRKLAVGVAQAWVDQQAGGRRCVSLPFLLEIGAEEIPDWMIRPALANFYELFREARDSASTSQHRLDATPRRLVLRAEGLPAQAARYRGARHGAGEIGARAGGRGVRPEAGRRASEELDHRNRRPRANITVY